MKKVLVIAYYFPPLGGSGVQRVLKFVKYLPQFGWQPTVLTIGPTAYYAKDESLLKEIEALNIKIVRTGSLDPNSLVHAKKKIVKMPKEGTRKILSFISDLIFIPDNKIGWRRKALKAASEILKKEKFDVIFATAPPATDFLVGMELKRRFGVPLVIDYRDSWLKYPFKFFPTPLHRYFHQRLERSVLRTSDMVVTTSRRTKEEILQRHKFLTHNDIRIIPHGFDPEDIRFPSEDVLPHIEKMRITYAGMFYANITPVYFLQAMAKVYKEHPNIRGRIEACFVGLFRPEYINLINSLGLQNSVNLLGYLEHRESVKYLLASDVLWVMMQDDLTTPGKIFEYIGAQKKILACIPKGYIASLIEEAGGVRVDPTNVDKIAEAIVLLYQQFERNQLRGARPEVADKYNRITLTGELAKIFTRYLEV
jgi:glycosyltransferase involved in cell wall biosynthesis